MNTLILSEELRKPSEMLPEERYLGWPIEGYDMPIKEQKPNDVGFDLAVRAVIAIESAAEQRKREIPWERKTLFDFIHPPSPEINSRNIYWTALEEGAYILHPGETVALGLGIAVEIPPGYAGYVEPRSRTIRTAGRSSVLSVVNSTVPIDPGFRAEIWGELHNIGKHDHKIFRGDVLFQLVVKKVINRPIRIVADYADLSKTARGVMSNGHTDELHGKNGK